MKIYDNKISRTVFLLFLLIVSIVLTACPAPAPNLTDEGSVPFQKPQAPVNVVATRGNQDQITLSWDPVENAELYIVYGIEGSSFTDEMQPYAYTTNNAITFSYVAPGSSLGDSGTGAIEIPRAFDRNEIYIFCVRSYVSFDESGDYLLSDNSDYTEGCFAPESIDFHAVVTKNDIRLYWNSSNLFSLLSTGSKPTALYKTDFVLQYRDTSTGATDTSTKTYPNKPASSSPWLYAEIPVTGDFIHNHSYEFSVTMNILDDSGSTKATVTSAPVNISMTDDLTIVNPITEIEATDGSVAHAVLVSWVNPEWSLPLSRNLAFFKIERSAGETGNFEIILDEISTKVQDLERISIDSEGRYVFKDDTADRGKTYKYRVTNAYMDPSTGSLNSAENSSDEVTGSVFNPSATELNADWDPEENNNSGTVTLTWNVASSELPEGLSWKVEKTTWHSIKDQNVVSYENVTIYETTASVEITESITNTCSVCGIEEKYHSYTYKPVIVDQNNNVIYEFGIFNRDVSLGVLEDTQVFRNFKASNNLVKAIKLEWDMIEGHDSSSYTFYAVYDGNNGNKLSVTDTNGVCSAIIDIDEDGIEKEIILRSVKTVDSAKYESPSPIKGSTLPSIEDINFAAGDGTSADSIKFTWNSFTPVKGVTYSIVNGSKEYEISDVSSGNIEISMADGEFKNFGSHDDYTYEFALQAKDSRNVVLKSNSDTGYIIPQPVITEVSKGTYSGEIHLSWSDYGEDVEYYRIYRYDNAAMSGEPFVLTSNEASFVDPNIPIGTNYYYTVASVKGNIVSAYETEFDTKTNNLPVKEPINRGYAFDTTPIKDNVVIDELADPNDSAFVAPYITVTFPANPSASSYTIQSAMDDFEYPVTYEVKDKLTTQDGDDIYTNGKASTEVGYVAYDAKAETITINTDAGILDSDLEIKEINIFGNGEDSSLRTNQVDILTNNANRNPNTYDYINMFNYVISDTLTEANAEFKGNWAVTSASNHNYSATDGSFTVHKATIGIAWETISTLVLNNRRGLPNVPVALTTESAIEMHTEIWDVAEYKLYTFASEDGNEDINITMNILSNVTVDSSTLSVKDANFRVKSINVEAANEKASGTYWVTPENGTESMVDISQNGIGDLIPYHANIGWND